MAKSTTSRKTTTTTARRRSSAAASAPAKKAAPEPETQTEVATTPALRKKALIERVVAQSGMKKKDVKPVVEATLAVLGEALSNQEPLNLQPLGKVMINRRKELANGEVLVTRIRRPARRAAAVSGATAKDPLADAAE